jgi:mono/diheme cytochrome c family protein
MGEAVAHSLQFLNADDAAALVAYLRTIPAHDGKHPVEVNTHPAALAASTPILPGSDELHAESAGLKLFEGACASCHQWNGEGRQTPYASLAGTRGVNDVSADNVTQVILQGVNMRVGDTNVFMPAFADAYSDTEVAQLANYVIEHFGGKTSRVTPADVAKRRVM